MSKDDLIGAYLGEYQLESLLGQGGMARVYRGLDSQSQRTAAIKVIEASFQDDLDYRARFEREAQAISRLHHPNIVKLYRFGEINDVIYIAMQYVPGADLASVMEACFSAGNWLNLMDICRVAREIGAALDYAHQQGIIHRDIKPSNILIGQQGQAILTDFGLALLADVGTRGEVFGTPYYISPEQAISSAGAVSQSDQYSLAVILYQMLTGRIPFNAGNPMDTAIMHITQAPSAPTLLRPALNLEIDTVILRALDKKPEDRFATCAEFARALETACKTSSLYQPNDSRLFLEAISKAMPSLPTLPGHKRQKEAVANRAKEKTIASKSTRRGQWRQAVFFILFILLVFFAIWFAFGQSWGS
jgi:serine/threonine-protein kinase